MHAPAPPPPKERLRQRQRALCRAVPAARREAVGAAAGERIAALPAFVAAGSLALFAALPDEPVTRPLFARARAAGKLVLFPRIVGAALEFALLDTWDDLVRGALGVATPPPAAEIAPAPELVVLPGRAFDASGARLGRGGGYYDRWLATLPPQVLRIALAYEHQVVDAVPQTASDEGMDMIATEARLLRCRRGRTE